jgi:hypothetical protein
MSYSRNYTRQIPYSGTVRVHHPKTESSYDESVNYSGQVSVNVVVDVDTRPFDNSVGNVKRTVDVLTGAVVAMNSAQCIAINQTATEVSQSLIDGFFGTIKTEISQQMQALDSAIKATFGLISEQGKAVSNQKHVMETDYNRISSRYTTLFKDLDTECQKRIYALDKPAFVLSKNAKEELILDAINGETAKNFIAVQEESSSKAMLLVSGFYRKVRDVMKTLHHYITQESRLTALINSSLGEDKVEERTTLLLPAIFTESDILDGNTLDRSCYVSDNISDEKKTAICERINNYCIDDSVSAWDALQDGEREPINREFMTIAEEEFGGNETGDTGAEKRRVYDMLINLWQESKLVTLKRSEK